MKRLRIASATERFHDFFADALLSRPAYHVALIDYAKPFTKSFGKNGRIHNRSVPGQLSEKEKALHRELMKLRNTFLAHSDPNEKMPRYMLASLETNRFL